MLALLASTRERTNPVGVCDRACRLATTGILLGVEVAQPADAHPSSDLPEQPSEPAGVGEPEAGNRAQDGQRVHDAPGVRAFQHGLVKDVAGDLAGDRPRLTRQPAYAAYFTVHP